MTLPAHQENVIRRLFRESETRRSQGRGDHPADADAAVDGLLDRLTSASTEMDRLRALVASQQSLVYETKRDLAVARRELADALGEAVRNEQLYRGEKERADQAVANLTRVTTELDTVRAHYGKVAAAVSRSFDRDDNVIPLRGVA